MSTRRTLLLLPGFVAIVAFAALRGEGPPAVQENDGPRLGVAHSLVKVLADEPWPSSVLPAEDISLMAARGECEGAHLVARAGREALPGLSVEAEAPSREGAPDLLLQVYREGFVPVETPSNTEGRAGRWPDPLIPTADALVGEKRNAFPVDVPAGKNQPVYVEVCVPADAPPGAYEGQITVRTAAGALDTVPLRVEVAPVTLPVTSSLTVTFGLSGKSAVIGHDGDPRDPAQRRRLVDLYGREALAHRISLHGMSILPPKARRTRKGLEVDFTEWDAEIGPFLDGTALSSGARFTATDLRTPEGLEEEELAEYYRQVEAHFRRKDWLGRLFAYVMDEPKPEDREELLRRLEALKAAPGIRRLVTTALDEALTGRVDIWAPNINCLEFKKKENEFCAQFAARERYRPRERAGEMLWWYQSCSSHGCNNGPFGKRDLDHYFTGWPSYMVDVDGAAARIMAWQAFARDVSGELYFDTVFAYNERASSGADPWDGIRHFGGNGDGTLFYPGRPDRIGGRTDIPVASLRLKHIRDGLEDYELLRLLAGSGPEGQRRAASLAARMAPNLYSFERDPAAFDKARAELFAALNDLRKN